MKKKPVILKIRGRDLDKQRIRKAVNACKENKVIAFPTETGYRVGGRMSAPGIEKRLREITGHLGTEPFTYYVSDWWMLDALKVSKAPLVRLRVRQFWPGSAALVVPDLTGRKIRIRFPSNKVALALIRETGEPLIAAGASRSGRLSPHTGRQALENFCGDFDCLIDGGKTEFSLDSTVVDLTGGVPGILRKGAQSPEVEKTVERIRSGKCPRRRILIVCTGNACRSPMAEGWLKREIEEKGLSEEIEVFSCGIRARDGVPCTLGTEIVMRHRKIDLPKFRSRLCRQGDLWSSDLIIAMAPQHALEIAKILPSVKERTITLNVDDPIGKGLDVYEKTFRDIEIQLERHRPKIFQ